MIHESVLGTRVNLKDLMLSEKSKSKKNTHSIIPIM